jgi:hypothetical protein
VCIIIEEDIKKTKMDLNKSKENTTQSPGLILKLNILQKRDDALVSIEHYFNSNGKKRSSKAKLKSSIKILFLELSPMLKRYDDWNRIKEVKGFLELELLIDDDDCDKVIEGFKIIDVILDYKKLILWDNYRTVDTFDIEAENKANHV